MKSIYGPLSFAMVRPLPKSFLNALKKYAPSVPIDWDLAHAQHEAYTEVLRRHLPSLTVVPVDERFPDCCFIEDTALVAGDDIVITRIGAQTRLGESAAVLQAFEELKVAGFRGTIHKLEAPATLDGGDVLQMGEHIFVGLSERTNQAAISQLKTLLPNRQIVSVPVADGLHLKSVLSALSDTILLAADTEAGRKMSEAILKALGAEARCVYIPDVIAANVVRLDQTVLIQEGFPKSDVILQALADELKLKLVRLNMSELIKADGALTCCSLLIPC